jgi:hypothetical protein
MNKITLSLALYFMSGLASAQVAYYKGEWTKSGKHDLFTGIFRINIIKNSIVKSELLWTYLAIDSTDNILVDLYKRKRGKKGIEYAEGYYDPITRDIYFEGKSKDDPFSVIGLDKYTLKLSADKKALYGKTDSNGSKAGMFYGIKTDAANASRAIAAAKRELKRKTE